MKVEIRNLDAAANWYRRVLGLVRHDGVARWPNGPMGPPILATRDANPVRSQLVRAFEPGSRDTTIAFRVTDRQFQDFLGDLGDHDLSHGAGRRLTSGDVVVDHDLSWSLCFLDPEGNRLEVTTRDYESVRSAI